MQIKKYFLVFFFPMMLLGQTNYSLHPSLFYTQGTYNKSKSSTGIAAYSTIGINYFDYLTIGFDNTKLTQKKEFDYNQNFLVIGYIKSLFPLYLKANIGLQTGEYSYKPYTFNYTDKTKVYSLGFSYFLENFYVGANYSYINLTGNKSVVAHQPSVNLIYLLSPQYDLSYKLLFTSLTSSTPIYEDLLTGEQSGDDRKLLSSIIAFNYYPSTKFYLRLEAILGKRAYYFNNDLLTFYNQDDTQNLSLYSKIDYELLPNLRTIFAFNYLSLDHSKIIYYSLGLKYNIWEL